MCECKGGSEEETRRGRGWGEEGKEKMEVEVLDIGMHGGVGAVAVVMDGRMAVHQLENIILPLNSCSSN